MGTPAPHLDRAWTVDDLLPLPDDGRRYEIVDGGLRVSPAPPWRHQGVSYRLALALERTCRPTSRSSHPPAECSPRGRT